MEQFRQVAAINILSIHMPHTLTLGCWFRTPRPAGLPPVIPVGMGAPTRFRGCTRSTSVNEDFGVNPETYRSFGSGIPGLPGVQTINRNCSTRPEVDTRSIDSNRDLMAS